MRVLYAMRLHSIESENELHRFFGLVKMKNVSLSSSSLSPSLHFASFLSLAYTHTHIQAQLDQQW